LKILVTGGAGFIGSNLCERLVNDGYDVTSYDNYFTGSLDNHVTGVRYINSPDGHCGLHSVPHYTVDIYRVLEPEYDIIYHLGEYSRVEQSFDDFNLVWEYNKIGTKKVLDFAKKCNAKIIYAGSSSKFTNEHEGYIKSPYTWSKESNTEFIKLFCEWNSIDYAIAYFYNVYGPREIEVGKYATLIASFKYKKLKGNKLTVVAPGTQKRHFTHVDDIIEGLIMIADRGHGDEFGIGNSTRLGGYSVLEVAEMFDCEIEMIPERKGNRMSERIVADRTHALGWYPKKSLKEYINEHTKLTKRIRN
jgi:UDP-glucose 4-epimerase